MDTILLIADDNISRRAELRHFFLDSGFLVMAVANGLECLNALAALEPDVLVIALELPRGGGDGVIAHMNEGPSARAKPLVFVIGSAPIEALAVRTGVAPCHCFSKSFRAKELLDRIQMELVAQPRGGEDRGHWSEQGTRRASVKEGIR